MVFDYCCYDCSKEHFWVLCGGEGEARRAFEKGRERQERGRERRRERRLTIGPHYCPGHVLAVVVALVVKQKEKREERQGNRRLVGMHVDFVAAIVDLLVAVVDPLVAFGILVVCGPGLQVFVCCELGLGCASSNTVLFTIKYIIL